MSNLLKRLEMIQSAIDLGDADVIALQAQRLLQEALNLSSLENMLTALTATKAEYERRIVEFSAT